MTTIPYSLLLNLHFKLDCRKPSSGAWVWNKEFSTLHGQSTTSECKTDLSGHQIPDQAVTGMRKATLKDAKISLKIVQWPGKEGFHNVSKPRSKVTTDVELTETTSEVG